MRQSEVTGLDPANDNQQPAGQGDLFGVPELLVGLVAIGDPIALLAGHADGIETIHEIMRRGDDPDPSFPSL